MVTGATGLVGSHLLARLNKLEQPFVATSRRRPSKYLDFGTWKRLDLSMKFKPLELNDLFGNANAIIHLAAKVPNIFGNEFEEEMQTTNVVATKNLGIWALKAGVKFIYISSATVYADPYEINITEYNKTIKKENSN